MTTPAASTRAEPPGSQAELALGDRLQPVVLLGAVGVGLVAGRLAPDLAGHLDVVVPAGVFALIYLVMVSVSPGGVRSTFHRPRFLTAAVVINFVVNPAIGWLLGAIFLRAEADLRTGLILFVVTPCIGWYLVFTELARGDTDLGVGLLGVNVVLQIALLPLYLALLVGGANPVAATAIVQSVVVFLVVPAAAAATTRWWWRRRDRLVEGERHRGLQHPALKTAALTLVIVAMFASQASVVVDNGGVLASLVPPLVLFFAIAFIVAVATAKRLGLPDSETATLVFTTTSRNSEASLAIAATAFASPLVGLAVVLGPVIELPLLVLMVRLLTRRRG